MFGDRSFAEACSALARSGGALGNNLVHTCSRHAVSSRRQHAISHQRCYDGSIFVSVFPGHSVTRQHAVTQGVEAAEIGPTPKANRAVNSKLIKQHICRVALPTRVISRIVQVPPKRIRSACRVGAVRRGEWIRESLVRKWPLSKRASISHRSLLNANKRLLADIAPHPRSKRQCGNRSGCYHRDTPAFTSRILRQSNTPWRG